MAETADTSGTGDPWLRWSSQSAFTAGVHLIHSALILVLTLLVQAPAGPVLRILWGAAALVSVVTLLVFLRVGNYEETTEQEVGSLVRRGYWFATSSYVCLAVVALVLILRA